MFTTLTRLLFICSIALPHIGFAEKLPVSAFSHLPTASDIQLSPSGRYIAYLVNNKGSTVLLTLDMKTGKANPIVRSDNEKFKFRWLEWVSDDYFIFSIIYPDRRYGTATSETRLLSASPHNSEYKILIKPRTAGIIKQHFSQFQDDIVSLLPNDKDHILVGLDLDKPNTPGVYKVNVATGGKQRVKHSRSPIRSWLADQQGRVRAGSGYNQRSGEQSIWIHNLGQDKWFKAWEYETFEQADIEPLGFGQDPTKLYIRADYKGKNAIFSVNTEAEVFEKTLVEFDPDHDINGQLIYSPKLQDVVGVYHPAIGGSRIYWHEDYKNFQNAIDKALPDTNNQIVSFSDDEQKYILYTSSDSKPGTYFYGDRKNKGLTPIIDQYPELAGKQLPGKQRLVYKARDGLEIEAYLSLPANPPEGPLPTIIHPHGGPMARDYGGFDYWTQFFNNRGYAVLQPNFRGSAGYGHAFMMQAVSSYGLAMQDDLEDATHWLIDQGIADPKRICIIGASYGGYAALMGAVKTPDLYQCAVSFAGVSDLLDQRNHSRNFLHKVVAFEQYGKDSKQLKQTSPRRQVEKINIPVLLVHGEKDRVVPVSQSRNMASVLRKHKKDFSYIELEDGTHGLAREQNRIKLFEAMDTFLAKYLPVQ